MRAEDGLLLGVLDDDPTGSQAVHGVQVVTVLEEEAYQAALAGPAATCFVLTNARSMEEPAAAEINVLAARGLVSVAGRRGARVQLVSRSDSTLRGHVMAEVAALGSVRRETVGRGYDGVLLVPAFLEAGRLTAGDIHWARVGGRLVPVAETEFAQDATFGYTASDLREFVADKSGGAIGREDVASIGLADIRLGGPQRVRELLAGVRDGGWAVVNATEYSDLETVAAGVLMAERAGASFLFRTGPSFVRALTGMGPRAPLRGTDIWPAGRPRPGGHGLVVVGSHVGQTSRQLAALRTRGGITAFELDVSAIVGGADVAAGTARQVAAALRDSDVLLYTSRAVARGRDGAGQPGHRPRGVRCLVPDRPRSAGRPARLGRRQGRHHLARHGTARPGHPARRGGRPAVSGHHLAAVAAGCGARGDRRAVRGVRRQRRRRRHTRGCGGHPQRRAGGALMQVGWLGLGAMGAPMAARAARAGHVVRGYDVVPGRAASLAGDGVRPADTVAAAVGGADLVVIMVATPGQVEEALFAPAGAAGSLAADSIVVVMATVGPEAVISVAERLAAGGVAVVDAPVSGGTARAASGDLLIMVSGPQGPVERAQPVLSALARSAPVVGSSPGDGQRMKLVNQLLCGVHIAAAAEALAFAEALGLTAADCWQVLREGAAASFMLDDRGARMVEAQFEPARSALDIFVKDMGLVDVAAGQAGAAAPLAAAARRLYLRGHDLGLGRLDDSALIEVLRRQRGAPTGR